MNNPFLQPPQKTAEEVPQGIAIDGTFICMTCDESCDEADFFPVEKILVWTCTEGHRSAIENFNLGV